MDIRELFALDKWIIAYLILKLLDFITGFIKAYMVTGFKSSKLRSGLLNLVIEIIIILLSGILDLLLGLDILLLATKMLMVYKEVISIVENAGICGVPIPEILKSKIQDLNPDSKKENQNEAEILLKKFEELAKKDIDKFKENGVDE